MRLTLAANRRQSFYQVITFKGFAPKCSSRGW